MAGLRKVGAAAESDGGAAKELSATRGRDKFELLLGSLSDARRKTTRLFRNVSLVYTRRQRQHEAGRRMENSPKLSGPMIVLILPKKVVQHISRKPLAEFLSWRDSPPMT